MGKRLLHVGCANRYHEGFENSDKMTGWDDKEYKLDRVMPLGEPWPRSNESVDGIVGMHVFQQLPWRELIVCFREAFRVLKPGGVLRMGIPTAEMTGRKLEWLVGWNNVNLLNEQILRDVLVDHIGFKQLRERGFRRSRIKELGKVDNREKRFTKYFEATKHEN
jgi:predicted SAM-dependent methyltransferase